MAISHSFCHVNIASSYSGQKQSINYNKQTDRAAPLQKHGWTSVKCSAWREHKNMNMQSCVTSKWEKETEMGEWGKQEIIHGGKGNTKVHPHGKGVHVTVMNYKFTSSFTNIQILSVLTKDYTIQWTQTFTGVNKTKMYSTQPLHS